MHAGTAIFLFTAGAVLRFALAAGSPHGLNVTSPTATTTHRAEPRAGQSQGRLLWRLPRRPRRSARQPQPPQPGGKKHTTRPEPRQRGNLTGRAVVQPELLPDTPKQGPSPMRAGMPGSHRGRLKDKVAA